MADILKTIAPLKRKTRNPFASESVIKILNFRIENEENSSRLYEAMSLWLDDNGYKGAAKRWKEDSEGELKHAGWAKQYLLDMGVQPTLPALVKPEQSFTGLPEIIRKSYDHEILITQQCNDMGKEAMKNSDHLLYQLVHQYLSEQQEELGKLQDLLDKLSAFGESDIAMRLLDNELNG